MGNTVAGGACRVCGRAFLDGERTVADTQLAFDGRPGALHPACVEADDAQRLLAELAACRAREAAAVALARKAGVSAATIRSALWRAERRALAFATPGATPRATPAAPPSEENRPPGATPDATPDATGAAAHIGNAAASARVEVPTAKATERSKPARGAGSPRIPPVLFKALCVHWAAVAVAATGRDYGPVDDGREQRIIAALGSRHGLPKTRQLFDAFGAAWRGRRPWWLRDEDAFTLRCLWRHVPELLHGPWRDAQPPEPTWAAPLPLAEVIPDAGDRPPAVIPPPGPRPVIPGGRAVKALVADTLRGLGLAGLAEGGRK